MRKLVFMAIAAIALAGCSVTAPTHSTQQAPTSQKDAVLAWASACQTFAHAEQMLATAIANHQVSGLNQHKVATIQQAVVPLCTTFPANAAAAITQITISATKLTQLLPTKAPASSTGAKP